MNTMYEDKQYSRSLGSLFLISMVSSMIYVNYFSVLLAASLSDIYPIQSKLALGAFLELINCVAVVGIAVMLFSILRRQNEILAICYVALRVIECSILIVGIISGLLLIPLSQEYLKSVTPVESYFQTLGVLVLSGKHFALQLALVICALGGLIFTFLFYRTKVIPRFLSVWGFVGYLLVLASALLDLYGVVDTVQGKGNLFFILGGLFEAIGLPFWLIVIGFYPLSTGKQKGE